MMGEHQAICSRCARTVPTARNGSLTKHNCTHGVPCRRDSAQPDKNGCPYCEDEAIDACAYTPTGPGP